MTPIEALRELYDCVIEHNRAGASWGDLFCRMMDAVGTAKAVLSAAEKAEPVAPADVWQLVSDAEVARFTTEGIQRLKIAAPAYIQIWQP